MTDEKRKVIRSIVSPAVFTAVIWLVWLVQLIFSTDLYWLGVYPRHLKGLLGILTSPFIHSGFDHLMSNSMPVFLLSAGILYFYSQSAWKVILYIYLFTGSAVWLLAGEVYHIGASGLIYGFAAFLYGSGIIRRDTRAIALALIVTFLYGGLVWGLFALSPGISWESHLAGSVGGIIAAYIFRKSDPAKKYEWEDEEGYNPDEKPEISWKKGYPFD